jgi:hypothetical protein
MAPLGAHGSPKSKEVNKAMAYLNTNFQKQIKLIIAISSEIKDHLDRWPILPRARIELATKGL